LNNLSNKKFWAVGLFLAVACFGTGSFLPAHAAGKAPDFTYTGSQTISEGDLLTLNLAASDTDGETVTVSSVARPTGAIFTLTGQGSARLEWRPEFSGPNSSEGSPFTLTFRASDGSLSTIMDVVVTVLNRNRCPQIEPPQAVQFEAGDLVSLALSGSDPDYDPISWSVISGPDNIHVIPGERGTQMEWQTAFADSGLHRVAVSLTDIYGAADTTEISVDLAPKTIYALSIDTVSGYSGETVPLKINLLNEVKISGFNILFNYDPTVLTVAGINKIGTRAADFEYFTYSLNYNHQAGDVQILGLADLEGGTYLTTGEGPVVAMNFYISSDYTLAGNSVPIRFVFHDLIYGNDNTLTDSVGAKIPQEAIEYTDGYILIKKAEQTSIGDINLNGVAFEIADAIYYINYFINPGLSPLNAEQRANADVNQDGLSPSIADLVYMINHLVNVGGSPKLAPIHEPVIVSTEENDENYVLRYRFDIPVGGIALTLEADQAIDDSMVLLSPLSEAGMTVKAAVEGNVLRVVVYSDEGKGIPGGINDIIMVRNLGKWTVRDIQFATPDGRMLRTVLKEEGSLLPEGFRLYQNYPNPFNPETEIRFDIPRAGEVELAVFNILGQEVRRLAEGDMAAGNHRVTWDGRDDAGRAVSSGIYFYRLKTGETSLRKKMVLLK